MPDLTPTARKRSIPPDRAASAESADNPLTDAVQTWGWPPALIASLLAVSERSLVQLARAPRLAEEHRRHFAEIQRLRDALLTVVAADVLPDWLGTANPAFDGLSPAEVVARGEVDRLWRMIYYLESGVAS